MFSNSFSEYSHMALVSHTESPTIGRMKSQLLIIHFLVRSGCDCNLKYMWNFLTFFPKNCVSPTEHIVQIHMKLQLLIEIIFGI